MATKTIYVADKPTLDSVKAKCDEIYAAVQGGGGGGVNLNGVHIFVFDVVFDEVTVTHGAIDKQKRRIQT